MKPTATLLTGVSMISIATVLWSAPAPSPAQLSLTGDWQVQIVAQLADGQSVTNLVDVPPPGWMTVDAERHDAVPVFNPKAGGWGKGARLKALVAQECTTPHLLEATSLALKLGPEPNATALVPGRDYQTDLVWGTFGRTTNSVLPENQPAFASYRHGLLRLDSIVMTPSGRIELRVGEGKAAAPAAPALQAGERRLANIWLPGVVSKLEAQNLFPVIETSFPEPPPESPTAAERWLPRTLAKLQSGQPLRILAWGDSVTDGSYLPGGSRERWQEQFVVRLRERFPKAQIELLTEAWGGRNTQSYLAEPPGSEHNYAEKVLARKPDLIVSEFVNDAGLNPEQVAARYGRLLEDFHSIGAEWIILTPHYVRPDWMRLKQEREIDEDPRPYVTGLRQFAATRGVALADASKRYGRLWRQGLPYSTLMLNSINHPNARGMSLFADSLMALFPGSADTVAAEWAFNRDGELESWRPNGDLTNVCVTNGVLSARGVGPDPILEYQGRLDLPADPWDVFEVRLKADRDGEGELFWSNTAEGQYGGFSQDKSTRFPISGDNQWHTYRVRPFWHPEGRIVRLRFDPYDATSFELDSLRILKPADLPAAVDPEFDFKAGPANWRGEEGAKVMATNGLLSVALNQRLGMVVAPPVRFDASQRPVVSLRMSVDRGHHATLMFASSDRSGLRSHSFPIYADGREHTYNLDLHSSPHWRGQIIALALRPSDDPQSTVLLRWFNVSAKPQGGPDLHVRSFGFEEFPARAKRPVTLAARLANDGGQGITNLTASLELPAEMRAVTNWMLTRPTVLPGEETTLRWTVVARNPADRPATISLHADNAPAVTAAATLLTTPIPPGTKRGYVPVPKPVRGPFEVGVYYFPGWPTARQWQPIQAYPERRPVLGWYREGDPEVADWHIKWAVEHGITFFIYDWYWVKGARQLEHGLHDGYFKARYHSLLKFCLLWANHNPPNTSSREDCLAVTRYWIEHYFHRSEHVVMDGKPVVIIFAPENLTHDLGADQVRPVFDAMRAECARAGLKGLYLVARVNSAAEARHAATEGYDAVTSYTWPQLGVPAGEFRAPYTTILEGYRREWQHILDIADIPLLPPVCGGWDSRPWHGEDNYIRFDRTPELFRQHLLDARQLLERNPGNPRLRNMMILEAWNEWGEGSYIEPHTEYGFGYLDAIRSALTTAPEPHQDVAPVDVGLGPYDVR